MSFVNALSSATTTTTYSRREDRLHTARDYREHLALLGVPVKPNTQRRRCQELLAMHKQNLPTYYDTCTPKQLHQFLGDRGLIDRVKVPAPFEVRKMVCMLEAADLDMKFTKFDELPAEMRMEVCGWYILGVSARGPRKGDKSPPLAKINRSTRKEAYTVFKNMTK